MQKWNGFLLIVALLVSSGAAGALALQRLRVERANRTVELVMDYEDIALLASAEGKTVSEWLKGFSTPLSVALTEGTLNTWGVRLQEKGRVSFLLSEPHYQQAKAQLALKSRVRLEPPETTQYLVVRSENGAQFFVEGDPDAIAGMGIGMDPASVQQVLQSGHAVVARLANQPNMSALAIRGALRHANQQGAALVIFAGDQVLGFRNQMETTAQAIRMAGMRYGSIEFGKQGGDAKLTRLLIDRTVRVHSVSAGESLTLAPQELVERFERAVQERNIRVVYLRMAGGDTASLQSLIQALERALARSGYTIARSGARPFRPMEPPVWLFVLVGLGVGVLTGWVAWQFRRMWGWAPLGLGVGFAMLCLLPIGCQGVALTAAILFPTLGLVALPGFIRGSPWRALPIPFGWSLLGALHIVGLLAESPFLIKADQFLGVKIAHVLPLLLVAGFYCAYATGRWQFWRDWLGRPVVWGQLAVMGVVVGALMLMLLRTGNEAPGAVSEWELRFRALLEQVMNVRPRTKEFLIGHPALVVALGLLGVGRREWLPLAMLLGAIGQVSLVNTFCHLHSPLEVSLMRTLWGILIGLVLGAFVWGVLKHLAKITGAHVP